VGAPLSGQRSRLANQLQSRLFVASVYDPLSILGKLFPYLGGSASVVVYSPHLQVRVPCILSRLANVDTLRWCLISKRLCGLIHGISPQPFQRAGSVNIRYYILMRALMSNYCLS